MVEQAEDRLGVSGDVEGSGFVILISDLRSHQFGNVRVARKAGVE